MVIVSRNNDLVINIIEKKDIICRQTSNDVIKQILKNKKQFIVKTAGAPKKERDFY